MAVKEVVGISIQRSNHDHRVSMAAHDRKPRAARERAWGDFYWAAEKPNYKIGHHKRSVRKYTPIPITKNEDGSYSFG